MEAAKNAAMYLKDGDGEIVNIPGGDLFLHAENVGLDTKHPKFLFYHKIGGNTGKCFWKLILNLNKFKNISKKTKV